MTDMHECLCNPDKICVWRPTCKEGALLEAATYALSVFRTHAANVIQAVEVGGLHNDAERRLQEALDAYGRTKVAPLVLQRRVARSVAVEGVCDSEGGEI